MTKRKVIIISAAILLVVCTAYVIYERAFNYDFDVSADYDFYFNPGYATIINVTLKNNSINLPKLDSSYNTAFLKISITKNIFGYALQPEVKMRNEGLTVIHSFEFGGEGIRYLNVTQFILSRSTRILFDCSYCGIQDGTYKLILYKNRDIKKERILVLSPHPDDAEIAAYGLYSKAKDVFIATITAGDAGKTKYENFYKNDREHYLKKGNLRVWNSITVPLLAGVNPQNVVNLGYFDGTLKSMYFNNKLKAKSKFIGSDDVNIFRSKNISSFLNYIKASSTWQSLVNDLKYILQKRNPTIIVTPYPAIDTHYDHKCTSLALFQAIKELRYKNAELWLYTNHYSDLYPIGEMNNAISLPPYQDSSNIFFNKLYSQSLSANEQVDKLFALDAMNDLRHNTEWNTTSDLFQAIYKKIEANLFQTNNSYYRRAVRSNELFYIVEGREIYDNRKYKSIAGNIRSSE